MCLGRQVWGSVVTVFKLLSGLVVGVRLTIRFFSGSWARSPGWQRQNSRPRGVAANGSKVQVSSPLYGRSGTSGVQLTVQSVWGTGVVKFLPTISGTIRGIKTPWGSPLALVHRFTNVQLVIAGGRQLLPNWGTCSGSTTLQSVTAPLYLFNWVIVIVTPLPPQPVLRWVWSIST